MLLLSSLGTSFIKALCCVFSAHSRSALSGALSTETKAFRTYGWIFPMTPLLVGISSRSRNLASASISVCGASLRTSPPSEMSAPFERKALSFLCFVLTHILSHVEPGPLLSDTAVKPPIVSNAVQKL